MGNKSNEYKSEKPIVTIIIPVYNVKDYLEKAFDSICSQTLTDWEMYLVDDGSTDGSSTICDILASDDSRIHVIHQENQGAAAARNAAIGLAKGKYLYFMDADDWAVPEMLYDMVCLAENYYLDAWAGVPVNNAGRRLSSIGRKLSNPAELKADIPEEQCAQLVVTGFYIETYYSDEDYYLQKQAVRPRVFADRYDFREYAHVLFDRNLLYTPWNKLYLASYIKENHITFPEMHWDDFPFNLEVIRNIERVTVTDKAYYHFTRKRSESESEKYNAGLFDRREEENEWLIELYQGWKNEYQEFLLKEIKNNPSLISVIQEPEEQLHVQPSAEPIAQGTEGQKNVADSLKAGTKKETPPDATGKDRTDTRDNEQKEPDMEKAGSEDAANVDENTGRNLPVSSLQQINIPSPEADEFIARRYLERIIGCVENVTNDACELTKKEKREEIRQMIHKESVRSALKTAKPKSSYMKLMLLPVRMKSVNLVYLEGCLISKVKKKNVKLFAKLKAGR